MHICIYFVTIHGKYFILLLYIFIMFKLHVSVVIVDKFAVMNTFAGITGLNGR